MDKKTNWWARHKPSTRRLVQLYTALLYNAHLRGFAEGELYTGKSKALCVPGLNCYSCPAAVGACPLGALQNAVAASASRPAFYVVGVLLLFGLLLGRVICGWACPMGLLQELLHKLPTRKLKKGRLTRALSWVKYGLLAGLVLAVPLYYAFRRVPLPAFCKYVCPAGTLEGAVSLLLHPANKDKLGMLGPLFTNKLLILVLVLTACVFVYRAFCRFLCPLGALYSLMTRLALVGVKLDRNRCTECGVCRAVCPMDIRRVGDRECIACGSCISKCPEAAISFRAGKIVLMGNETTGSRVQATGDAAKVFSLRGRRQPTGLTEEASRRNSRQSAANSPVGTSIACPPSPSRRRRLSAWLLALAVLAGALLYFNRSPAAQRPAKPTTDTVSVDLGCDPGQTLPDFTIQTLAGEAFTLSEHRGELVVLNLWATWCGPCVKELPIFEAFSAAYPDAFVLAVHGPMITEDVSAWLAKSELSLPFAVDTDGSVTALLGASNVLPHTVVLDRSGTVLYNAPGSVTMELLEQLYASTKE
ncbi:MAG: 4Fe-4S binding protein [Oscillospiraceae bacterium]|nr:4Fe-4S binding protein [Oscillospiraceae bacterium]MBQ6159685.1 4Fe-4S binding protein [Oscillospiraceae bacterium]